MCICITITGTNRYFRQIASKFIETSFVDLTKAEECRKAMKPNTKVNRYFMFALFSTNLQHLYLCYKILFRQMVWVETPTNPLMQIIDIAAVAKIAHEQPDVIVVVDNTFASAYFQVNHVIIAFTLLNLIRTSYSARLCLVL